MLTSAAGELAPGGRLVYSTCSMEPEENEAVVAGVLAGDRTLRRVPSSEAARSIVSHLVEGAGPASFFDADGQFTTAPGEILTDGFFAGILTRDS